MSGRPTGDGDAEYEDAEPARGGWQEPAAQYPAEPGKLSSTQPWSASGGLPRAMAPGKISLTQLASASARRAPAPGSAAHRPPPTRVADGPQGERQLNAVLKVVVIDDGKVIQRWQSKAHWDGPLPVRWTAVRGDHGWRWDHADARSLKVQTDERGRGGKSVDAWAAPSADRIVVYVRAIDDVTIDADAEVDAVAPGHARDRGAAGGGAMPRIQLGRGRPAAEEARAGGEREPVDGWREEVRSAGAGSGGDGESGPALGEALGPSEVDERLADAFERALGIDPGDVDVDGGGDIDGRAGRDTRKGGTGPGGAAARPDGKGRGSEDGRTAEGAVGGSRDGERGGDEEGMYGGEGERGDRGVPSAVALLGGLLSVPAALRGFVELALIVSSADVTGAGKALFQRGIGKLASAVALRQVVAHEARIAAMRETQAAMRSLASNRRTAAAFARLTKAEQQQLMRITYWELQRKYFQGYLAAARQAKADAAALLRRAPRAPGAQARLRSAELAEEAATAQPVAGRLPQNHELAGKPFPSDQLPAAYRQRGLRFKATGYPDFEPYAMTLPNKQKYVEIAYTGSRSGDFAAANAKAGFQRIPAGYTWHHSEELGRMYLVPDDLHEAVRHTGGVATHKHVTGEMTYGR